MKVNYSWPFRFNTAEEGLAYLEWMTEGYKSGKTKPPTISLFIIGSDGQPQLNQEYTDAPYEINILIKEPLKILQS